MFSFSSLLVTSQMRSHFEPNIALISYCDQLHRISKIEYQIQLFSAMSALQLRLDVKLYSQDFQFTFKYRYLPNTLLSLFNPSIPPLPTLTLFYPPRFKTTLTLLTGLENRRWLNAVEGHRGPSIGPRRWNQSTQESPHIYSLIWSSNSVWTAIPNYRRRKSSPLNSDSKAKDRDRNPIPFGADCPACMDSLISFEWKGQAWMEGSRRVRLTDCSTCKGCMQYLR